MATIKCEKEDCRHNDEGICDAFLVHIDSICECEQYERMEDRNNAQT